MKKIICALAAMALLLTGCGSSAAPSGGDSAETPENAGGSETVQSEAVSLETLLNDIHNAIPGTAGSSLKQAKAAGELVDWAQSGNSAGDEIGDLIAGYGAETAFAYAAVLDFADRIVAGDDVSAELEDAGYALMYDSYDTDAYHVAVCSLSPIFIQVLNNTKTPEYVEEPAGDYSAITLDRFDGIWCEDAHSEMLIFSGDTCRVVIPYLNCVGETAYPARIRDRSDLGYCPALEIDLSGAGTFDAPLAYYVSGIDDTHFWTITQGHAFYKVPLE